MLLKRLRPTSRPDQTLFAPETVATLEAHSWPGNVRELANVVEHAAILGSDGPIGIEHLPGRFGRAAAGKTALRAVGAAGGGGAVNFGNTVQTLRDIEMAAIQEALARNSGNKPKTAEELGISLKTLYNKLNSASNLEQAG
jgi:two-component system NtrC family response regulator